MPKRVKPCLKTLNAAIPLSAKSIRLETATKVIDSATTVIRDLAELKRAVRGTPDEQALSLKINRAIKSIQDLVPVVMTVSGDN